MYTYILLSKDYIIKNLHVEDVSRPKLTSVPYATKLYLGEAGRSYAIEYLPYVRREPARNVKNFSSSSKII